MAQGWKIDHPRRWLDSRLLLQVATGSPPRGARERYVMAARRPRPEKKILSKQEVASRKKALAVRRVEGTGVGPRALVGVAILALSSLALVALLTDPGPVAPRTAHNGAGPVGHALAALLGGLLGITAPAIPLAGVYVSGVLLVGKREKRRWPQVLAAAVLLVATCVLVQLGLGTPGAHPRMPPGGALGVAVSAWLVDLFEVLGTVIVVSAVAFAAMLVATQFALLRAVVAVGHLLGEAGSRAKGALVAFWAAQKKSFAARAEARAAAKLEEAAFLAQLEADEEELSQAEAEALEAEAVAEEAMRLARESESKALEGAKDAPLPEGADPAWARELAAAAPVTSEAPRRRRKSDQQPEIVTPLPAISAPAAATLATAAAAIVPAAEVTPAPDVALVPTPARAPLIVEPKAPPKPTTKHREQNQFEFVGGRTQFTPPPLDVLDFDRPERSALDKEAFFSTAEKLRAKLADFGIVGEVVEIRPGPVVTMYEFLPGPGIKVSKIAALADDLAMAMEAMRVRIVAPIPGKGVVGIEVPNRDRETVYLKEIVEQDVFQRSSSKLTMALGKDIEGMPYVLDLAKGPHVLAAGTTGSGKSVAMNSMVMSILLKATPEEVRFIMVDPKMLELSVYEGIPHLLLPVVTDPKKAALALRWAVEEMERRYQMLSEAGVRNIAGYNKLVESAKGDARVLLEKKRETPKPKKAASLLVVDVGEGESEEEALARAKEEESLGVPSPHAAAEDPRTTLEGEIEAAGKLDEEKAVEPPVEEKPKELKKLPYLVVIIDELADLMMVASREVETYIARLAQMARAAGIHLLVATQRPSTDVVTGVIKANFPTRISFMLRSKPDSMTILGTVGAEALLGMGDMLIMPPTSANLVRVHGAYVSEQEIKRAVDHLKAQGKPVYDESILRPREEDLADAGAEDELSDELYDQALAVVSEMRQVSISMLQRKMRIGYNRAARMIERMERDGVVGPADGAKPREVLLRPLGEMPGAGAA